MKAQASASPDRYRRSSICRVLGRRLSGRRSAIPRLSFAIHFDHSQATEDDNTRRIPELGGVHMPESIEERLKRIEAYLHMRYLYLKEKPRTSFEEMELLKAFGFDETSESVSNEDEVPAA
jgi:hypothetical protein